MTQKEAIEVLEIEARHVKSHLNDEGKAKSYYKEMIALYTALTMGIEALKTEAKVLEILKK